MPNSVFCHCPSPLHRPQLSIPKKNRKNIPFSSTQLFVTQRQKLFLFPLLIFQYRNLFFVFISFNDFSHCALAVFVFSYFFFALIVLTARLFFIFFLSLPFFQIKIHYYLSPVHHLHLLIIATCSFSCVFFLF